ncbi:STAS domain-containing protein [Actinoplanes sp. NEAU-A11]|uniref:STAS domain-containing protein n=2 Tax=Actinoplanes aureus TaxID=2792083 RepID=A0A931CAX9_9ACTN|nr:STAS domain-containing protein [Actinoplanes aureus]
MATADDFRVALRDAVTTGGVDTVVVDLAEVTFCDSSGMAVLDEMYGLASDRHITFRLVNPQKSVRRVLEILGMTSLLHT